MKKFVYFFAAFAAIAAAVACDPDRNLVEVKVQLALDGSNYAADGVVVSLAEAAGTAFEAATDASGLAAFKVPAGAYTAATTFKQMNDGVVETFTGLADVVVLEGTPAAVTLPLTKVKTSQIIIKELYCTACPNDTKNYSNDAYVTLYNNSAEEADASEIVFGVLQPANAHATNKYYDESGQLIYNDWVPAYSAIWYFQSPVKIAPYSSITVAIFGAIDHTSTVAASVNLAKPEYYVMAKEGVAQITATKYQVSDVIDHSHYLTCKMFNLGNAWVLSNTSPAFFIGKMDVATLTALVDNTAAYDVTGGTTNVGWAPKFPVANILDAVECWDASKVASGDCRYRFPAAVNAGHIALTTKLGHTFYRNVDKEATEALAENEGKLVYGYTGGTADTEGSTDPSGIDAEASIKAGAHIIYSDTNNSGKDFHERKVAALK